MFRKHVISTNRLPTLEHAILGLCAEAGEAANIYKASLYKKKPLDRAKLLSELSDVRWYLEACLIQIHTTIEEIEQLNVKKLQERAKAEKVPASNLERRIEALIAASHPHLMPERGEHLITVMGKMVAMIEDLQKDKK